MPLFYSHLTPETSRIFSIANLTFDGVEPEEKLRHAGESEQVYDGYKLKKTWVRIFIFDQVRSSSLISSYSFLRKGSMTRLSIITVSPEILETFTFY